MAKKGGGGGGGGGSLRGGGDGGTRPALVQLAKADRELVQALLSDTRSGDSGSGGGPAPAATIGARAQRSARNVDAATPAASAQQQQQQAAKGVELQAAFSAQQQTESWRRMQPARGRLPALAARDQLLEIVARSDVTIVSGGTGCGKSTQVPQFILDDLLATGRGGGAHIICTQPRRIAAIGVAERVAEERSESIGAGKCSVGYSIRGESRRGQDTRLLFCTTGILLKMLEGDHQLGGVSHVIIDEVHERSCDSDLLLLMTRELLLRALRQPQPGGGGGGGGPRPKVILMSATLAIDQQGGSVLGDYFGSSGALRVGTIEIEGRTFPVERRYLSAAIECCGFSCRAQTVDPTGCIRQDVTAAMVGQAAGSGSAAAAADQESAASRAELVAAESADEGSAAPAPAPEPELTVGQAMIASNRAARLQKQQNVRANSARGAGRLGGEAMAWVRQRSSLFTAFPCVFSAFPCGSTALTEDRCNQVDRVGQNGMRCVATSLSGTVLLDSSSPRVLPPNWCPDSPSRGKCREADPALAACSARTLDALRVLELGMCAVNIELLVSLVRHIVTVQIAELMKAALASGGSGGGGNGGPGNGGAVLVFLPGAGEINGLLRAMQSDGELGQRGRYLLLPLHSELSTADQKKVFSRAPAGAVKIVLATNIAEASVTIDDVVFVVDTGTHKEMRYDPHTSMAALVQSRVSVANATQRAGRAGRVR
eukprot:SAG22_NODE_165_length_16780_cov_57.761525_10_plen_714_part_00